jgi:hypothetical protein
MGEHNQQNNRIIFVIKVISTETKKKPLLYK